MHRYASIACTLYSPPHRGKFRTPLRPTGRPSNKTLYIADVQSAREISSTERQWFKMVVTFSLLTSILKNIFRKVIHEHALEYQSNCVYLEEKIPFEVQSNHPVQLLSATVQSSPVQSMICTMHFLILDVYIKQEVNFQTEPMKI